MKARYLIITSALGAAFSVLFLYYYTWLGMNRHWSRLPAGQSDAVLSIATIALIGCLTCLFLALIASLIKALRRGMA